MNAAEAPYGMKKLKIRIERPIHQDTGAPSILSDDVRKYVRMIPSEPEPNMGRVQEIKDEIKNGTYLKSEMLDETAARLAARFTKKR